MIRLLSLFTLAFIFITCKKQDTVERSNTEIANVTGISWQVVKIQKFADAYINPIPVQWYLNLNADGSFVINLKDYICTGVYTWTQIDSSNSNINFTIQTWKFPPLNNEITAKLKDVLEGTRFCELRKYPFTTEIPNFFDKPSLELEFTGNNGYFRVVKF